MRWLIDLLRRVFQNGIQISVTKELPTFNTNDPVDLTPAQFLEKIRQPALDMEGETGIPWSFAATQAAHESRYGNSKLTREANNLFGITGDSWYTQGKPVYWIETTEYSKDKVPFRIRRPFRKYDSWNESLRDWATVIIRRYPSALAAAKMGDFERFASGLQTGGYATDPRYATQLVALHRSITQSIGNTPLKSKENGLPGDSVA